jgi:putative spermidine/putrescine transport system permease protein
MTGRLGRIGLRIATGLVLAFIYLPLAIIVIYAFNEGGTNAWPPAGFTVSWFGEAMVNTGLQQAFLTSIACALGATVIALVLGLLVSIAVSRYAFFGRESISFVILLPIALPGIVTGMALSTAFASIDLPLGILTVIIGHATFCVVLVYNNAIARLRRTSRSFEEASADLGAHTFQTFRHVTFPAIRSALLAGALLAFALSFDEVIVTTFTAGHQKTLPIWMLSELIRPRQRPVTNVVAVMVIAVTALPILAAYYLTREGEHVAGGGK